MSTTIVPSPATRATAVRMADAIRSGHGAGDVVLEHLPDVWPGQSVALVVALLNELRPPRTDLEQVEPVSPWPACSSCHRTDVEPVARNLCRPCYDRHWRTGDLAKFPPARRKAAA